MKIGYNRFSLLGSHIDNLTMFETLQVIDNAIVTNNQVVYADLNADKVVSLQQKGIVKDYFKEATIVNADGQAIIWAAKMLGTPLKERVTGVDLMAELVNLSAKNNYKIYFLGAKEEVVLTLVNNYITKYGKDIIAGYRNGYFNESQENEVVDDIIKSKANILFVAITSPKKEEFLYRNKSKLSNVNFIMGVGGSFDVHAGFVKRAPKWIQNIGFEWAFRIYQEPKRMWKRYLVSNSKFLLLLFKSMFFDNKK